MAPRWIRALLKLFLLISLTTDLYLLTVEELELKSCTAYFPVSSCSLGQCPPGSSSDWAAGSCSVVERFWIHSVAGHLTRPPYPLRSWFSPETASTEHRWEHTKQELDENWNGTSQAELQGVFLPGSQPAPPWPCSAPSSSWSPPLLECLEPSCRSGGQWRRPHAKEELRSEGSQQDQNLTSAGFSLHFIICGPYLG